MRTEITQLTPEMAKDWLEKYNTENFRKLAKKTVTKYSNEMRRGRWVLNGESIKFGMRGKLIDGQHRLAAVVQSGVTVETLVVWDACGTSAATIDRGKSRSIPDILNHEGFVNTKVLSSAVQAIVRYAKGLWAVGGAHHYIVDSEIVDFCRENNEELQSVIRLCQRKHSPLDGIRTTVIAIVFIANHCRAPNNELSRWFIDSLISGEGLTEGDAVLHLRNRLIAETPTKVIDRHMKKCLTTIAWNKTALGESCTPSSLRLRLTGPAKQSYPDVIFDTDGNPVSHWMKQSERDGDSENGQHHTGPS